MDSRLLDRSATVAGVVSDTRDMVFALLAFLFFSALLELLLLAEVCGWLGSSGLGELILNLGEVIEANEGIPTCSSKRYYNA